MLHISNAENVETETSKDGFDLGEESSNKTEAKDKFGTFEAEQTEEKKPIKTKKDVIQNRISVNKAKIEKLQKEKDSKKKKSDTKKEEKVIKDKTNDEKTIEKEVA